jgi:hypothetical protein
MNMGKSNQFLLKILTVLSLIFLSFPLLIYRLWIKAFNLGTSQSERVSIFNSYFPDSLQGRWDTTYLSISFCLLAIILSSICLKLSQKFWKILNIIILIFSSLLLLLNLFSMM